MMSSQTFIIWLFLCGIVSPSKEGKLFMQPPRLRRADFAPVMRSVTLNSGTNFKMHCDSEHPITWKQFEGFTGSYQVSHAEVADTAFRYEATIHLTNITYHYVGFYYCVTNVTQSDYDYSVAFVFEGIVKQRRFSGMQEIYVFVNDNDNRLVHRELPEMTVVDDKFLILTCKPTSTDTSITLFEGSKEILDYYKYDTTMGFVLQLSKVVGIYGKSYTCRSNQNYFRNRRVFGHTTKNVEPNSSLIIFNVTYHVASVESSTGVYGTEGGKLTLNCSIEVLESETFAIDWKLPNGAMLNRLEKSVEKRPHPTNSDSWIGVSTLTIKDIDMEDEGYYQCEVIDHFKKRIKNGILIEVLKINDTSVDIYVDDTTNTPKMEMSSWEDEIIWQVRYKGKPKPSLAWYNEFKQNVISGKNYEVVTTNDHTVLKIKNLWVKGYHYYTLIANNSLDSKEIYFRLAVKESPRVAFVPFEGMQKIGMIPFSCQYYGHPEPTIMWKFTPCDVSSKRHNCDEGRRTVIESKHFESPSKSTSLLYFNATEFGKVECYGVNSEGIGIAEKFITKVYNPASIVINLLATSKTIVKGDNITMICEGHPSLYLYVRWHKNNYHVENDEVRTVEYINKGLTLKAIISWTAIRLKDADTYTCNGYLRLGDSELQTFAYKNIEVLEPKTPEIEGNVEQNANHALGTSVQLECNIDGVPFPVIKWWKDDVLIENGTRFMWADERGQTIEIKNLKMQDNGTFKCVGENSEGNATKLINLKITSETTGSIEIHTINIRLLEVVLVLALIATIIYLSARLLRKRRELNFENGNPERINPQISLHEQADLLPYNKKYEFPSGKIKLGKQLGAGAFGVVVEGLAVGIRSDEEHTKVAVKMLKESAGKEEVDALATELKIMANLGQHLNIVNLLGAVTKKLTRDGLMVIFEYCRFGNVQKFLLEHRHSFVDQINPENDSIDPSVRTKEQSHLHDTAFEYLSPGTLKRNLNLRNEAETSFITDSTSDAGTTVEETIALTTSDLVCWSFQVASGMKYLSSRRVLHGDLAARNVLLSDGNVVKICDFGLARSLYKYDIYKKDGAALLPFKWLAIESVCDRVFSTFSDIWSFGILMWELFSLGATPYPGLEANLDLFNKLKDGYRMEKAKYATEEIHEIMLQCWIVNPESRPLFNELEDRLRKVLEKGVAEHYIDLNGQYVEMNAKNFGEGQIDYLARVAPPEKSASSIKQSDVVAAYLTMRPICSSHDQQLVDAECNSVL